MEEADRQPCVLILIGQLQL